jgi:hypothetical protein
VTTSAKEANDCSDLRTATAAAEEPKKKPALLKGKLPIESPKKINFGPPKPPRQFDYVGLSADGTKAGNRKPAATGSGDKRKLSPRQLFEKLRGDTAAEERSPVLDSEAMAEPAEERVKQHQFCFDNQNSDLCDEDDLTQIKASQKIKSDDTGTAKSDSVSNLYVTLGGGGKLVSDESRLSSPATPPPPPLPASLPPSAEKAGGEPTVTMYENVWIDSDSSKPVLSSPPPLPAR